MPIEEQFVPPQNQTVDPELAALVDALFSRDGETQKTVLDATQVIRLARAEAFAELYNIPELQTLCSYLMQLKISEKGRGRKDLVAALQTRARNQDDQILTERSRNKLIRGQ